MTNAIASYCASCGRTCVSNQNPVGNQVSCPNCGGFIGGNCDGAWESVTLPERTPKSIPWLAASIETRVDMLRDDAQSGKEEWEELTAKVNKLLAAADRRDRRLVDRIVNLEKKVEALRIQADRRYRSYTEWSHDFKEEMRGRLATLADDEREDIGRIDVLAEEVAQLEEWRDAIDQFPERLVEMHRQLGEKLDRLLPDPLRGSARRPKKKGPKHNCQDEYARRQIEEIQGRVDLLSRRVKDPAILSDEESDDGDTDRAMLESANRALNHYLVSMHAHAVSLEQFKMMEHAVNAPIYDKNHFHVTTMRREWDMLLEEGMVNLIEDDEDAVGEEVAEYEYELTPLGVAYVIARRLENDEVDC